MNKPSEIARLTGLSQMVLDHRLSELRKTADRLEQSRMQLHAISEPTMPVDLEPIAAAKLCLDYDRWADARRAELNLVIARNTADYLDAREIAQTAFGRVQALQALVSLK